MQLKGSESRYFPSYVYLETAAGTGGGRGEVLLDVQLESRAEREEARRTRAKTVERETKKVILYTPILYGRLQC